jgi:hypothetical protein
MSAGKKIRIEDLRDPVLNEQQKAALAYAEANPVELTLGAVLGAAVESTGLEDFGPEDFHERLGLWLSETDENPERTALGRMSLYNDCVRWSTNRLRIRDLLERHPEIHDLEIKQPIIVLWESQQPVPGPEDVPGPDGIDPRWQRSEEMWQAFRSSSPLIASMHPMNPDHIHEELELQLPDFSSYNQEWITRCPKWRDYLLSHDQRPHYRYMKTALKILQWYRPRDRWVLKCPQHLEQIGPLMETFPDATIVVTHRDPVSVIQSSATMLTYGARMNYTSPRPEWYLEYWTDRIRRLLEASVRDRHLLPADRTIDVLFHEFMADDVAMVERIYEVARLPMTAEARAQIHAYMAAHPRGKEGQVVYDLRKDFDADPKAVRAPFDFYLNEFDVRLEVE